MSAVAGSGGAIPGATPAAMLRATRACVTVAVVLAIVAGVVDAAVPSAVPEAAREAFGTLLRARPPANGALVVSVAAIYWLALAAAIVGLFRGRGWGFTLGVVVTVVTVVQAVVLAPHAYSGVAFAISYVSKVAWGAGLALAWAGQRR